jgi:hypothetical protein
LKDVRSVPVLLKEQRSELRGLYQAKANSGSCDKGMLGTNATEVFQQSNYRAELELWLCSLRRPFQTDNCVVMVLEGAEGNFMAFTDVTL